MTEIVYKEFWTEDIKRIIAGEDIGVPQTIVQSGFAGYNCETGPIYLSIICEDGKYYSVQHDALELWDKDIILLPEVEPVDVIIRKWRAVTKEVEEPDA